MKTVESAINLAIMTQEGGAEYLYDLANDEECTQKDKENCLKEVLVYIATTKEEEAFSDMRGVDADTFINENVLYHICNKIFEQADWTSIINYHKNMASVTVVGS